MSYQTRPPGEAADLVAPATALVERYDLVLLDLDGVVWRGERTVPRAGESIAAVRERVTVRYVTNNASRRPAATAELLHRHGIAATPDEVLTSAQASARLLAGRLPPGGPVLVVGADALAEEVAEAGLRPVAAAADRPLAVVQGYGPEVGWRQLAEAMQAVAAGALWVATNTDRTLPSEQGPLPGNGALVAALAVALDRQPELVVGKPEPALFTTAADGCGAGRPLVVGDRLDTDIRGAVRAGYDSLVVLTGVATAGDVLAADPASRPTYIGADLADLLSPYPAVPVADAARCGGWTVTAADGGWRLSGRGTGPRAAVDALRALCGAHWSSGGGGGIRTTAGTPEAADALSELGLAGSGRPSRS